MKPSFAIRGDPPKLFAGLNPELFFTLNGAPEGTPFQNFPDQTAFDRVKTFT
jgi:hypothetical protein